MRDSAQMAGLIVLAALAVGGCASVDFDKPKGASWAFTDTGDTQAGQNVAPLAAANPGKSGFLLQPDGIDALATRLLLAQRAERSIDAQYYLVTNDVTGRLFIEFLLTAADRGVRVRLLLDDIQTKGYDVGLVALDHHPNFEVRIWNPFARGGSRSLNALGDLGRVNRRMHNKTFTVDNQLTIIGGRNIAAEYFAARPDVNFGDLDALAVGPVVQDVSRQFDSYWNDPYALPVTAFIDPPDDPAKALKEGREDLARSREEARETPYADALRASASAVDEIDEDDFIWAHYELVYDSPAKTRGEELEDDESIVSPLRQTIGEAQREFTIVSPYFVPLDKGVENLSKMRARGVDVTVATNSLASNNHAIVHSGYAPYRRKLLENGVRLFEARPDIPMIGADQWEGGEASEATLHTKGFLIDREVLFLGSFNMDPRSIHLNTELGVIIQSPEIAGAVADRVDRILPFNTYEVFLDENGEMRWRTRQPDGTELVFDEEPQTSWWDRFSVNMMRILPIRGQL